MKFKKKVILIDHLRWGENLRKVNGKKMKDVGVSLVFALKAQNFKMLEEPTGKRKGRQEKTSFSLRANTHGVHSAVVRQTRK
jgi:hypothetical protein